MRYRRHWVRSYVRVRYRRPEHVRGHIRPKALGPLPGAPWLASAASGCPLRDNCYRAGLLPARLNGYTEHPARLASEYDAGLL
jgi:hypothetical protein